MECVIIYFTEETLLRATRDIPEGYGIHKAKFMGSAIVSVVDRRDCDVLLPRIPGIVIIYS